MNSSFFSFSELKQPVNQWLCITFFAVFCFWLALYYFTTKAEILGESWIGDSQGLQMQVKEHR